MSKKQEFIKYVEDLIDATSEFPVEMSEGAKAYWEGFKKVEEVEKPLFTDNGKLILQYLQENVDTEMWKARDIAEGLFINSRAVAGTMRKLVTDGYVDKVGENPTIYTLTETGKNIEII